MNAHLPKLNTTPSARVSWPPRWEHDQMDAYRRPGRCVGESNCAEVDTTGDHIRVRNSRTPQASVGFTIAEWRDLVAGIKAGEFDV